MHFEFEVVYDQLVSQHCFFLGMDCTSIMLKLPEANLYRVLTPHPHPFFESPILSFFFRGPFFVLTCSGEEGLGSQLATYWLFQSPDPVVCLECITLLCTVTTCQVSG